MTSSVVPLQFSLRSILIFTALLSGYIAFHVWVERNFPTTNASRQAYLAAENSLHYYFRAPKDVALMLCYCLLLSGAARRPAAVLGRSACLMTVALSCTGFFFARWQPGWMYRSKTELIWTAMGGFAWVLMAFALIYAIGTTPADAGGGPTDS